jgi:hypothetical protein
MARNALRDGHPNHPPVSLNPAMTLTAPSSEAAAIPGLEPLASAIVAALAYADVFDWPLTPVEVHRALPVAAELEEVAEALTAPGSLRGLVAQQDGFVMLAGHEALADGRRRRMAASRHLWHRAARVARVVAALPLVRMVAVTGSLAVGAAEDDADVDLLVVTEDERLWLTRAMTIGVVRAAAAGGVRLCPNYFLAASALELRERDLFTAHELTQMVPVAGLSTYRELLERNGWYRAFLPNHPGRGCIRRERGDLVVRRFVEQALRSGLVDPLERWEMRRKVTRLRAGATSGEQRFDESVCKGHFEEHGQLALAAYRERLTQIAGAVP